MITTRQLVPEVYYNDSRDFQFIGRLFEIAFNEVKTGVDLLANNPFNKNIDTKLLDLVAKTIGFDTKHKYTTNDLKIVCSCFKELIRKKGSKEAIEILVRALLRSQNIKKDYIVEIFTDKDHISSAEVPEYFEPFSAIIQVPYELKDMILIEDVLEYILPAGCDYRIIQASVNNLDSAPENTRVYSDKVSSEDIELVQEESGATQGAATLYSNIEVATIK